MSSATSEKSKGKCFVVMGFNKKTDFESGRTLDLDKSYRNMIKPAVEAAGLECVRADEIVHSGLIDVPMYQQLLEADVVVADVSTSNRNAYYELGVRHALRPYTTVVICEDGAKTPPFDINHIVIRQYHHLGEDIGFDEAMRFRGELTKAIVDIWEKAPEEKQDSPVYRFIERLTPPSVAAEAAGNATAAALKAGATPRLKADDVPGDETMTKTHSMLMQQVDEAQKRGDFVTAKTLLSSIRQMMKLQAPAKPEDPYIVQRLALVSYKSKFPTEQEGLQEARELLKTMDPATSNDTETLGLWGAVHKRLWYLTKDRTNLDEAVRGYARGFYLRNDYYNGINLAYVLNERAAAEAAEPAEAITDFILARRVRKEVLQICEAGLADNSISTSDASEQAREQYQNSKYWVLATMAEACFGLGDDAKGEEWLAKANAAASKPWMQGTTNEQIAKLKSLLADSPLKRIT
ncbi:MAG: tetratricopeptide repeat-containing protein [Pyrinomonadaceae bacterium]